MGAGGGRHDATVGRGNYQAMTAKHTLRNAVTWIGLLISFVAVAWLVRAYDWSSVWPALREARWSWLAASPILLLLNFAVRTARWRRLFPLAFRLHFASAFTAMMAGYLFNNILPARAGELVRVHMIGKRAQLPRSTALGTVVLERTLDLLVLLALLAFVMIIQPLPGWAAYAGKVVAALAFAALATILTLGFLGERIIGMVLPWLGFLPPRFTQRLDVSGRAFVSGISALLHISHLTYFFALTAVAWVLELLLVYVLAQAFRLDLGFISLLFVMLVIALGTMVPASPGYVGTFEVFGASALLLLGISGGAALGFVLTLHMVVLLGSSLTGLVCLAWYGGNSKPVRADVDGI